MAILVYSDADHTYQLDGVPVPSVTSVLRAAGLATDYSQIDPAVLERARQRGNAVHELADRLDRGEPPDPFVADELRGYQDSYLHWLTDSGYTPIASEVAVSHPTLFYAGRCDAVGWIGGVRTVIDRKSTAAIDHAQVSVQCAAYALAWDAMRPGEPVASIAALHLRRDGLYRLHPYNLQQASQIWRYALEIYRWKRTHRK